MFGVVLLNSVQIIPWVVIGPDFPLLSLAGLGVMVACFVVTATAGYVVGACDRLSRVCEFARKIMGDS